MNFTKFDLSIIVVMSLAIISMAFVFPALGLADTDPQKSDIPEYNSTGTVFNVKGDFPDNPGIQKKGTLFYQNNVTVLEDDRRVWLQGGGTSGGTELLLIDNGSLTEAKLILNYWEGGTAPQDTVVLSDPGDKGQIENTSEGWVVEFDFVERTNSGTENVTMTVDFDVKNDPGEDGLIGGLNYIASLVFWFVGTVFEIILAVVTAVFNIVTFVVDTLHWLTATYAAIITTAETWAAVFVMIPFIALFFEFMKLIMIGVSLLPGIG